MKGKLSWLFIRSIGIPSLCASTLKYMLMSVYICSHYGNVVIVRDLNNDT
ncbi:hypothetical protein MXB_2695 [Myxobolus squamalis]|nr:hypothetical protein MXB_2695 [Myxobolus squamalis]